MAHCAVLETLEELTAELLDTTLEALEEILEEGILEEETLEDERLEDERLEEETLEDERLDDETLELEEILELEETLEDALPPTTLNPLKLGK